MTSKQMNQTLAVVVAFVFILGMLTVTLIVRAKAEIHSDQTAQNVVVYEDGSGVQYAPGTNREIRTFPENTFAWDCATMGNHICGKAAR